MIDPGQLRERVTVQVAAGATNVLGETTLTWSDSTTVWAAVNGVSSQESLEYGQQDVTITHRVRMRYVTGLTHKNRLKWRDRVFNIVSLLEYGNRSEHVAVCEEGE